MRKIDEIRPSAPPSRDELRAGLNLDADNRTTDTDPEVFKCRKCAVQWKNIPLGAPEKRYQRKDVFEYECPLCRANHRIEFDGIFVEVTPL